MEFRRTTTESKNKVTINKGVISKLSEMAFIENTTPTILLEKLILAYTPIPYKCSYGEFKETTMNQAKVLRRTKPQSIIIGLNNNGKVGYKNSDMIRYKNGEMSWEELKQRYVARLIESDSTEEIKRLLQFKKSNDIYITSVEPDNEKTLRKVFINFVKERFSNENK